MKVIIIIPTLNESGNINIIYNKLKKNKYSKILFVDDNSNDGTIQEIKKIKKRDRRIEIIIRKNKVGVGSAHKQGLMYSYKKKFNVAVTLDADGTHNPYVIPKMIKYIKFYDLVITNRFKYRNALKNWHWTRKYLTLFRFYLINILLNINYDTSGAFRIYNLSTIKKKDIMLAKNNSYSFFWESTYFLNKKKYKIKEIPIILPYRKIGVSKMKIFDVFSALNYLIFFSIKRFFL